MFDVMLNVYVHNYLDLPPLLLLLEEFELDELPEELDFDDEEPVEGLPLFPDEEPILLLFADDELPAERLEAPILLLPEPDCFNVPELLLVPVEVLILLVFADGELVAVRLAAAILLPPEVDCPLIGLLPLLFCWLPEDFLSN